MAPDEDERVDGVKQQTTRDHDLEGSAGKQNGRHLRVHLDQVSLSRYGKPQHRFDGWPPSPVNPQLINALGQVSGESCVSIHLWAAAPCLECSGIAGNDGRHPSSRNYERANQLGL